MKPHDQEYILSNLYHRAFSILFRLALTSSNRLWIVRCRSAELKERFFPPCQYYYYTSTTLISVLILWRFEKTHVRVVGVARLAKSKRATLGALPVFMVLVISPQKKKERRRRVLLQKESRNEICHQIVFQKHKRENPGRSLGVRLIMYIQTGFTPKQNNKK